MSSRASHEAAIQETHEMTATNRQTQAKRSSEKEGRGAGMKKGRSALGDVTNHRSSRGNRGVGGEKGASGTRATRAHTRRRSHSLHARQGDATVGRSSEDMDSESCTAEPVKLWQDIDKDDNNPLACALFAEDIMTNLFRSESTKRPNNQYMEQVQQDITPYMRSILVDWLVEVAQEYKLVSETLYLSIDYLDRYLSVVPTPRNHLQLVGVTCMLLAAKYEEIYAPTVDDFCFITENTYTKEELLITETRALSALKFELTTPSIRIFMRRFVKAAAASHPTGQPDVRLDLLSSYITELSLLEYQALRYLPSTMAASAVLLAQFCLCGLGWNETLEHYTRHSAADLRECTTFLHKCLVKAPSSELPATREKYSSPYYGCVSNLTAPPLLPNDLFL